LAIGELLRPGRARSDGDLKTGHGFLV